MKKETDVIEGESESILRKWDYDWIIERVMEYVNTSRYMDALLLLSLRAREVKDEYVIDSTSCFSTSLLGDLIELGYIDYSNNQNSYVITEKGKLTLRYVKKPWNSKNMRKWSPVSHQNDQLLHTV